MWKSAQQIGFHWFWFYEHQMAVSRGGAAITDF
jgi:hypothetical protein